MSRLFVEYLLHLRVLSLKQMQGVTTGLCLAWVCCQLLSKIYHFLNAYTDKIYFQKKVHEKQLQISKNGFHKNNQKMFEKLWKFLPKILKNCTNRVPLGVPICLLVFLVNNMVSFGYYKQDQIGNHRRCCVMFFQKQLECSSYS